jgi:succinate dehydrogenase / fumarate reductase iron-sulfur subunit
MNATLQIQRGTTEETPRVESYEVAFEPGQSVLDGLRAIRRLLDPSLAYRFSCINANACKECMMLIDGKVDYACTVRLKEGVTTLAPLPKKALIRDLVTEIAPPDERL